MPTSIRKTLLLLVLMIGLASCAASRASQPFDAPAPSVSNACAANCYWWEAGIVFTWPDGAEPSWFLDGMAADQVIRPVLELYRGHVPLWRFHRRAVRDASGHRFSVLWYSDEATAKSMFQALAASRMLEEMTDAGLVHRAALATVHREDASIGATSDPQWRKELREAWPAFAMGMSTTWLSLVSAYASEGLLETANLSEISRAYERAEERVREAWKDDGQSAFLHHSSALFGYAPVSIRKEIVF